MQTRRIGASFLAFSLAFTLPTGAYALAEITDVEMSGVSGAGLAFVLDDLRFQMAPTSYIEQVGGLTTGSSFNRGDLRWYGFTMSAGTGAATTWSGSCGSGLNNMGCPIGVGGIGDYGGHDNPFVLRVFDYTRVGLNGAGNDWVGSPVNATTGQSAGGINRTVLELLGPSNSDDWRWAFWGEIQASTTNPDGSINTVLGTLQNQNLIFGKPATRIKPPSIAGTNSSTNPFDGSVLQIYDNQSDSSLGLLFHSRLSGDYRFSVNQNPGPDPLGVPQFTDEEGFYFSDVSAFLPLGQLHYQSIVFDDASPRSTNPGTAGDGNFVIELTQLPNDPQAYNDLYSIAGTNGYQRTDRSDRYYQTHGYVEWGTAFPTCTPANCMSGTGVSTIRYSTPTSSQTREQVTSSGISFASRSSGSTWAVRDNQNNASSTLRNVNAINLGSARVEGLLIQHMKITTLGAGL